MSSQGPIVVNSGADAGDNGNSWNNTAGNVTQNDGVSYAECTISSGVTNTLKCKFNTGAFTIPLDTIWQQITISFKALHGQGSGQISSVKNSVQTQDVGNNANLQSTVSTFTYTFPGGNFGGNVNGAWEIDLQFTGPGTIEIQDVTATITFLEEGPQSFDMGQDNVIRLRQAAARPVPVPYRT